MNQRKQISLEKLLVNGLCIFVFCVLGYLIYIEIILPIH